MIKIYTSKLKKLEKLTAEKSTDWVDYNKTIMEINKDKKKKEELEEQIENTRIANLKCPVCKSDKKHHVIKKNNNGKYGPGYSSWEIENYFVCLNCGVMFKDLKNEK